MHGVVTLQQCSPPPNLRQILMLNFLRTFSICELAFGQMGGRHQHFVNTVAAQKLSASYCSFTGIFTTSTSWRNLTLTFM